MTATLTYVQGDAIAGAVTANSRSSPHEWHALAHGCNDVGAWGAGFTAALDKRDPTIGYAFRKFGPRQLGAVSIDWLDWGTGVTVANLITQHGVGVRPGHPIPFRYHALGVALRHLATAACRGYAPAAVVHMPRIGCGLAGATWEQVEPFVREHLVDAGLSVVVYDL
jgi:hypothetical protein